MPRGSICNVEPGRGKLEPRVQPTHELDAAHLLKRALEQDTTGAAFGTGQRGDSGIDQTDRPSRTQTDTYKIREPAPNDGALEQINVSG